jgi:hypothetical protein
MAGYLKSLSLTMGVNCAAIGLYHSALGVRSVPGAWDANTTMDSRERFYNVVFGGYGLAWIWAARQTPISANQVRFLAGLMAVGGVARLVSMADRGKPHWFQTALTVVEFVVPAEFLRIAAADEKNHQAK